MATDAEMVDWVRRVLGVESQIFGAETATVDPSKIEAGLSSWNAARQSVAQQIALLKQTILAETKDDPDGAEIEANIDDLDVVTEALDDRLAAKLDRLRTAADPSLVFQLVAQARELVAEYQEEIEHQDMVDVVETNGFVPVDIRRRVNAALSQVLAAL